MFRQLYMYIQILLIFCDKHEKPGKIKQGWYSACGGDGVGGQRGNGVSSEDKQNEYTGWA